MQVGMIGELLNSIQGVYIKRIKPFQINLFFNLTNKRLFLKHVIVKIIIFKVVILLLLISTAIFF